MPGLVSIMSLILLRAISPLRNFSGDMVADGKAGAAGGVLSDSVGVGVGSESASNSGGGMGEGTTFFMATSLEV